MVRRPLSASGAAGTFDKLDGALARRLGLTEPLPEEKQQRKLNPGNIMDDFADAISFYIAPAWICYIALTDIGNGRFSATLIGWIALIYAFAGIIRLVFFTIDRHPIAGFFKGLPTPAAALLVLSSIVIFDQSNTNMSAWIGFWGYFSVGLMIFCAAIMNFYPVKYIHVGRAMSRNPWITRMIVAVLVLCAFTPDLGQASLAIMVLYVLSPLTTGRIDPEVAARESRK